MNKVELALKALIDGNPKSFSEGHVANRDKFDVLNKRTGNKIPEWYINLLSSYPISHVELTLQDPTKEFEHYFEFASPQLIESEVFDVVPGSYILEYGYICIALDISGGGNPYFINFSEGEDPAIYQIYHDTGETGEEILELGKEKVADSLSELFRKCEV